MIDQLGRTMRSGNGNMTSEMAQFGHGLNINGYLLNKHWLSYAWPLSDDTSRIENWTQYIFLHRYWKITKNYWMFRWSNKCVAQYVKTIQSKQATRKKAYKYQKSSSTLGYPEGIQRDPYLFAEFLIMILERSWRLSNIMADNLFRFKHLSATTSESTKEFKRGEFSP